MTSHYDRIYRLACEPAHITDLPEFMPTESSMTISLDRQPFSILWSHIALYYGIHVMCQLLRGACKFYGVNPERKIDHVERSLEALNTKANK